MACGDVLSLEDLQAAKKHQIFEAEVITGKTGGVAGGATIDTATNPVTGQTQQTLPSILADLGFDVQSWTSSTGGVLASANQVFLNDTSGSLGLGDYYAWGGPFPKTVPAGTDPALPTSGYIMRSSRFAGVQAREALRRTYAEVGCVLISGSFESGGVLNSANDVLLHEVSGKAYTGAGPFPQTVVAGTNPGVGGFVDRSRAIHGVTTVAQLASGEFTAGAFVRLSDRGYELFKVVSGGTPDGYGVINAGNGNTAVVTGDSVSNLAAYGTNAAAFNSARAQVVDNGTIHLPPVTMTGTFTNQFEELKGEGTSSKFVGDSASPVLTIKRKTSSIDWDFYKISDLSFDGAGASACVSFDPADPFSGRTVFDNVQFRNGTNGVNKPTGNIGDAYVHCNFRGQDYGWNATSSASPVMHTGAAVFYHDNWDVTEKACIKASDNVDGPGGLVVRDSLMQGCNGFGIFLKMNGFMPFVPPTFDSLWMEQIAKNASTVIDGVTYTTRQMRYDGVPYVVGKGSYLKSAEVVNGSVLHLTDCRMDDATGATSFIVDDTSWMPVDNLYGNGSVGDQPFVRSIANQTNSAGTKNLSVRGPLKQNRIRLAAMSNAVNVCSNSYAGTGPWPFTGTSTVNAVSVSGGVLGDTCAELVVPNGATLLSGENGTPTDGRWAVFGIHAKKVSGGEFTRARMGFNWVAGNIYFRGNEWTCSYGIKKVSSSNLCRLELVNNSGAPITVRLADFFVVTFATFREAIEFVNSGLAIRNDV